MKKKYSKPIAVIESFQLDTGIAACSDGGDNAVVINKNQLDCEFDAGGMIYFTKGNDDCNYDAVSPGDFSDKECYHGYNNGLGLIFIAS